MREEEKYFLIAGLVTALLIAFFVAQHNRTRGYSFGITFFYSTAGIFGLVCIFWQWYWK